MQTDALSGGFDDPAIGSATAFRAVMEAMARPGTIRSLSGAQAPGLSAAASAVLLTLCDPDTGVYLAPGIDTRALRDWIAFHTGAPLAQAALAQFAVGHWEDLQPIDRFAPGTPDYPDRSATLIVEMPALHADGPRLSGPGIRDAVTLSLPDTEAFRANHRRYPLGLDFVFTCGDRLAALPRSTKVI